MKIAAYGICRNEESVIERCIRSVSEADLVFFVDTGSTDNTVDVARRAGAKVEQILIDPWRFDDARNASLALMPADMDFCVSIDADEIMVPGWRKDIEDILAANPKANHVHFNYIRTWQKDGSPGSIMDCDRVHARRGFRWKYPIHELLVSGAHHRVRINKTLLEHHPVSEGRPTYMPMLALAEAEYPHDARIAYLYGRSLMDAGRYTDAIVRFSNYIGLKEGNYWVDEFTAVLRYRSRCYSSLNHYDLALADIVRATKILPHVRETWVDYAFLSRKMGNWKDCQEACLRALAITTRAQYINEPAAWSDLPEKMLRESIKNLSKAKRLLSSFASS